ncbi:MAG TPA: hypothetical protein VFC47_01905 [Caulobacteraceae bacterium]|nr:hypothetical protein [Caulobacteraceae bacterium]
MSEPPAETPAARKRRRFWLNVGEVAAVLAVVIAGLNYWDSHREHAQAAKQSRALDEARSALVIRGSADADGRRIALEALRPGQAIQSQRYVFPTPILDHAMEVAAARPQIDAAWISAGLGRALQAGRVKGDGEATLPVGVATTYVEDGQTREDRSLYRVGYAWRSRFIGGRRIILQGIALDRRKVGGDLRPLVDGQWAATAPGRTRQDQPGSSGGGPM